MTPLSFIFIFTFFLRGSSSVQLRVQPAGEVVVVPGGRVSILCQAGVPITHCRFRLPHLAAALELSPTTSGQGSFAYHGKGLQSGDCGLTLLAVSENMNGTVVCAVNTKLEKQESTAAMRLTVAKGPTSVELRGISGDLRAGDTVTASCVVRGSNPPASITWLLDKDAITEGTSGSVVTAEGGTTQQFETSQNLTRVLSRADNNRELSCAAQHAALGERSLFAARTLTVLCAPTDFQTAMMPSDFVTGRPGTVAVILTANPPPSFRWWFGTSVLESGHTDPTGRFHAEAPLSIGHDQWWAALRVAQVRPRDHGLYLLEAKNTAGEATFYFTVDNSETPRGLKSATSAAIAVSVVAVIFCALIVIVTTAILLARRQPSLQESPSVESVSGLLVSNALEALREYNALASEESGERADRSSCGCVDERQRESPRATALLT